MIWGFFNYKTTIYGWLVETSRISAIIKQNGLTIKEKPIIIPSTKQGQQLKRDVRKVRCKLFKMQGLKDNLYKPNRLIPSYLLKR